MLRKILDYKCLGPLLLLLGLVFFIVKILDISPGQQEFLPGTTSDAHYQIELACDSCHTPLDGVKLQACLDCHQKDLKEDRDSHAKKVFNDPRSYELLAQIDAKNCLTCHAEHIKQLTGNRISSLPADFCYPCHKEVTTERESHKDLAMNSCADSGCHNYHDNRALYEDFIAKHLNELDTFEKAQVPLRNIAEVTAQAQPPQIPLTALQQDGESAENEELVITQWEASGHARAGVNCSGCHVSQTKEGNKQPWTDYPDLSICESCHELEMEGFLKGKHGMRISVDLPPMQPGMARLSMKSDAADKQLTCNSCHQSHRYDTKDAAVQACLKCHNDQHSKAYVESPHQQLWKQELSGLLPPGSGVSCATCHMPRLEHKKAGQQRILVMHNQNHNLQPNSKMLRSVCMDCHGYGFSLQALSDPKLSNNNYDGMPGHMVETLEMVADRLANKKK